ncbi:hypothetical protein, partial [Porphyromonas endodontalis]|uniref:hypothetical protein n=1 Tax=Porphyromonas endodontalis TaxID=28124 RepID=UPI003C729717
SNYDFGVILTLSGQGSLSAETEFVGQRHTLPVSRVDAIEASTFLRCPLRGVQIHVSYLPAKLRMKCNLLIISDIPHSFLYFPILP